MTDRQEPIEGPTSGGAAEQHAVTPRSTAAAGSEGENVTFTPKQLGVIAVLGAVAVGLWTRLARSRIRPRRGG
jgi:hypothetical protein